MSLNGDWMVMVGLLFCLIVLPVELLQHFHWTLLTIKFTNFVASVSDRTSKRQPVVVLCVLPGSATFGVRHV